MYPLVREVYFHAVDVINLLVGVHLLNLGKYGVNVGCRGKVYAVFGDIVVGERRAQLAHLASLMRQRREEQGYADKGVTAIVALGINHAAVAFAADYRPYFFHLGGYVHLAYGRCRITAAVTLGHIAQGAGAAKVADRVARRMAQHIVGNGNKRIFLAEHAAVLTDERQAVNVRVNHDAEVEAAATHTLHYAAEVLLKRFGVVGEVAVRRAVKYFIFNAKLPQQFGQDYAANAVYSVNADTETRLAHSLNINKLQVKYGLYVLTVECFVIRILPETVNVSINKVFTVGQRKHLVAVGLVQELTLAVEQLQGVPLARIVACGYNNAAVSPSHAHGKLCGRGCGQADVNNVEACANKRAANNTAHHVARNAGVTANNYFADTRHATTFADEHGVSRSKLNYVKRIERVARLSANRTTNT